MFYPIFHSFVPGRAEQLCAERHKDYHTFGRKRLPAPITSLLISGLSPGLRCPALHRCTHGRREYMCTMVCWWYTQEWYRWVYTRVVYIPAIPGWCTSRYTRVVHPCCTRGGPPCCTQVVYMHLLYPGGVYAPCCTRGVGAVPGVSGLYPGCERGRFNVSNVASLGV